MASSLAVTLNMILSSVHTNAFDLSTPSENLRLDLTDTLANGTSADQANEMWHDRRSLAATTESIDLAGSLTNIFGETLTFTSIVALIIHNRNTTVGHTLTIGGAAANAFTLFADTSDKYVLGPNGVFMVWEPSAAGKTVTAATGDILKMDAGANTISYDIIVIGRD